MLAKIEDAIEAVRNGKMIIIVDDEDRENEGDLMMAAQFVTPEAVNFMATYGRGLICAPLTEDRLKTLNLPMMVPQHENTSGFGTGFTVSVEAVEGVSTGISAFDRAKTIQTLVHSATTPDDLATPGHIFPLRARDGGVLVRRGQTEASVDFARLAGLTPAGVICEIMNEDGSMARLPELEVFAETHDMLIVSVEDLVQYRLRTERVVESTAETTLPTSYGDFKMVVYTDQLNGKEHVAMVAEPLGNNPLVRVHSECMTGDVFGSRRCDCGHQLDSAMTQIADQGGMVIYLRQEGRDIGLANKIRAYALQDEGMDTIEANLALGLPEDCREYYAAAHILRDFGIERVRLMTNNPEKIDALLSLGVVEIEREPTIVAVHDGNRHYLNTKRDRMGHLLPYLNGVAHE